MAKQRYAPTHWLNGLIHAELPQIIRSEFDFLVHDYGFKRPRTESLSVYKAVYYRAQKICIEPIIELKYPFIDVSIHKLSNGKLVDGWRSDAEGNLIQFYLMEGIRFRKAEIDIKPPDESLNGEAYVRSYLKFFAQCLKTCLPELLNDSDDLFIDMDRARKKKLAVLEERKFYGTGDELFQKKLYAEFIRHCDQEAFPLSSLWHKRLSYAKKRVR